MVRMERGRLTGWGVLENGQRRGEREEGEEGKHCRRRRIGVAEQAKGNLPP